MKGVMRCFPESPELDTEEDQFKDMKYVANMFK